VCRVGCQVARARWHRLRDAVCVERRWQRGGGDAPGPASSSARISVAPPPVDIHAVDTEFTVHEFLEAVLRVAVQLYQPEDPRPAGRCGCWLLAAGCWLLARRTPPTTADYCRLLPSLI
jgi:hypothetical protein